jgi:hypothetical protein
MVRPCLQSNKNKTKQNKTKQKKSKKKKKKKTTDSWFRLGNEVEPGTALLISGFEVNCHLTVLRRETLNDAFLFFF